MSGAGTVHALHPGARWINVCQSTRSGPIPNVYNATLALRSDPEWQGRIRYDEMLCSTVVDDLPLEDIGVYHVHLWLQDNGLKRLGLDAAREALEIVGHEHPFHPVRDYLLALAWDGYPRVASWLHAYLGAEETNYAAGIGTKFLISMCARIFEPGCKADYMLVLEGAQRTLKSSVCEVLASTPYFSDTLPDIGGDHVRVSTHLRGKWLIEVSELSAFNSKKVDAARLKNFLTTKVEQFTPKHARKEVREPRQCVFVGTTNDSNYLHDPTGGRRFWPVKCGFSHPIQLDALKRDRDQLLAEALDAYQRGVPHWPEPDFEEKEIKPHQDDRYEADAWDEPILAYLSGLVGARVTIFEIATKALFFPENRISRADQFRIHDTLIQNGWKPGRSGKSRFFTL